MPVDLLMGSIEPDPGFLHTHLEPAGVRRRKKKNVVGPPASRTPREDDDEPAPRSEATSGRPPPRAPRVAGAAAAGSSSSEGIILSGVAAAAELRRSGTPELGATGAGDPFGRRDASPWNLLRQPTCGSFAYPRENTGARDSGVDEALLRRRSSCVGSSSSLQLRQLEVEAQQRKMRKRLAEVETSYGAFFDRRQRENGWAGNSLLDRQTLTRDVERVNVTLRKMNRFIVKPHGQFMLFLDLATTFSLLFTAIVTPCERPPSAVPSEIAASSPRA
jgi:hypothetical protein